MKPDALERLSACRPDNPPLDAQERADLRASIVKSSPAPAKVVTRSLWRRRWGPALVFVGVATAIILAVVYGPRSSDTRSGSRVSPPTTQAGSQCRYGKALTLSQVPSENLTAGVSDAGTVIVAGSRFPSTTFVVEALRSSCSPDEAFGTDGIARLQAPPGATRQFEIESISPGSKGSVILAGTSGNAMLVGRLLPDGRLDPTFGRRGWVSLVPPGRLGLPEATSVVQESSGLIVVAGDDGGCTGCYEDWVTAVTPHGALDRTFGAKGWVHLFTQASQINGLLDQPHDRVLVMGERDLQGCATASLALLTSSGAPAPGFQSNFAPIWGQIEPPQSFIGGIFGRSSRGFAVVGLGTDLCSSSSDSQLRTEASGFLAGFEPNGVLDPTFAVHGLTHFTAAYGELWAVPRTDGYVAIVVDAEPLTAPSSPHTLTVTVFSADGSVDRAFGNEGVEETSIPVSDDQGVIYVMGDGNHLIVISQASRAAEVRIVRD
jgi:uncharacterized delta-60 repeat protein